MLHESSPKMDFSVSSNPMPRPTIQSSQNIDKKWLNKNTKSPSETSLTTNQNFLPKCEMGLKKARKKRLTGLQVRLLESSFNSNRRLDAQRKLQLATELSLPPRQVAIWYQNRRARHKNQTIELDYKTIQIKLDTALVENERLEREVDLLKQQLHKAHEMLLIASNYPPAFPLSSHSASDGGDDGWLSFPGRMDGSWGSSEASPIEELYATCLASPEHQPEKAYPHPHDFWAASAVTSRMTNEI